MEKQNQSTLTIVMGENGKYGVRNQWGVMKQLCVFDRIEPDGEGTLWTYKDDLMGCVDDQDGDTMVSCRWKEVKDMEDFYFKVMDGSGKWGVVSDANEQELPCKWNDIKTGIEDQYIVQDNSGLWGVTECDGYMVIPCQWNKIENTLFHYLVKDTEEKTGIYNRYG